MSTSSLSLQAHQDFAHAIAAIFGRWTGGRLGEEAAMEAVSLALTELRESTAAEPPSAPPASRTAGAGAERAPRTQSADSAQTGIVSEASLLHVWDRGAARSAWTQALAWAHANRDRATAATALAELDALPDPLTALAASGELVARLAGARWIVVRDAREAGTSWEEIAEALRTTPHEAYTSYREQIGLQERYEVPGHDAARARAALGDDPEAPVPADGSAPSAPSRAGGPCGTPGCGTGEDLNPSDPALCGWISVHVAGSESGPIWCCSSWCASAAIARSGGELAAADRAAEIGGTP